MAFQYRDKRYSVRLTSALGAAPGMYQIGYAPVRVLEYPAAANASTSTSEPRVGSPRPTEPRL